MPRSESLPRGKNENDVPIGRIKHEHRYYLYGGSTFYGAYSHLAPRNERLVFFRFSSTLGTMLITEQKYFLFSHVTKHYIMIIKKDPNSFIQRALELQWLAKGTSRDNSEEIKPMALAVIELRLSEGISQSEWIFRISIQWQEEILSMLSSVYSAVQRGKHMQIQSSTFR